MPRIRTLKPEIHQDEAVGELTDSAFRLFIGLITQADDAGRLKGDPRLIGAQVWPYQPKTVEEVDAWLEELFAAKLIQRYEVADKPYISLPSWSEHQRVDNAGKSRIPEPNTGDGKVSPRDPADGGGSLLDQGSGSKEQGAGEPAANAASAAPFQEILHTLDKVAFSRGVTQPKVDAAVGVCRDFADKLDLDTEVEKFAHYWIDGPGEKRDLTDVAWSWRQWLDRIRKLPRKASHSVDEDLQRLGAEAERQRAEEAANAAL
jgi:hypothetical protein